MSDVITLARPEELPNRPSIGLHLLVKNGASVVGRLISSLAPYLTEVVAVLNDCDDDTMTTIASCCLDRGLAVRFVEHGRRTNPENYIPDVAETYQVGRSLVGESYEGPFTGIPILADWAAARNAGWGVGTADFKLMLDADDEVADPHCLPGLCRLMDERGLDVLATRYHYGHTLSGVPRADAFRERLVRNLPEIRWSGKVHECLAGYDPTRVAHVDGNLVVHDRRDSTGREIRIPGRNLKVLYHRARAGGWRLTPREMIYLAAEAKSVMPILSARLVELHIEVSRWDEEKAWASTIMGEIYEAQEAYAMAAGWYERSLKLHPGVLAAMRLARVYFHMGMWAETISAYERGVFNKAYPQFLDGGQVFEDATKIFVAASLRKLGRLREAAEMSGDASRRFPESPALAQMAALHQTAVERGRS